MECISLCQEYINKECATLIWEVNAALAKDDVRSRCRLVVNIIKCTKQRPALCYYYCSCLTQTHHNSVHSIQINEVLGKLWSVHLLHLMIFTTSLLPLLTSSFANALLTPHMGLHTLMWYTLGSARVSLLLAFTWQRTLWQRVWRHIIQMYRGIIKVSHPSMVGRKPVTWCGPKKGQHHKAQYKFTTTLISCKPMQPCIASITNYKSCIHCFPYLNVTINCEYLHVI